MTHPSFVFCKKRASTLHGFHIHTIGTCTAPNFTPPGGHFNPSGATHGNHAGDQPVLLVNADGTGSAKFETDRYAITALFDADGSAFIVHAGARSACGRDRARVSARTFEGGALGCPPRACTLDGKATEGFDGTVNR